jgi:hypothetical protein
LAQITLCLPRRHTSPIWLTGGLFGKDLELTGFEMGEIDLRMASLEDPVHREAKPLKTSVQGDVVQNGVVASLVMVIVASPTSIVASSCTPMGKWAGISSGPVPSTSVGGGFVYGGLGTAVPAKNNAETVFVPFPIKPAHAGTLTCINSATAAAPISKLKRIFIILLSYLDKGAGPTDPIRLVHRDFLGLGCFSAEVNSRLIDKGGIGQFPFQSKARSNTASSDPALPAIQQTLANDPAIATVSLYCHGVSSCERIKNFR